MIRKLRVAALAAMLGAVAAGVVLAQDTGAAQVKRCESKACWKAQRAEEKQERRHRRQARREAWRASCTWASCPRIVRRWWHRQRAAIDPDLRARLKVLRGCETRGIPFPQNYRWDGHHDGAYQYDTATWAETGGSTTFAHQALPAEQDVRTARFFPSHTSRWACSA